MHRATLSMQASKIPAWLPQPLRESYIQSITAELTRRETLRSQLRDPVSAAELAQTHPNLVSAYSNSVGRSPINARFNRYLDVLPYDRSRVTLPDGGYVNASWVQELNSGKWTIATQAPLDKTAYAFLSIFLQPLCPPRNDASSASPPPTNRIRTIVQLTPNVEGRLSKATPYFPKTVGEEMIWPPPRLPSGHGSVPPIKVKLLQVVAEGESWTHSVLELSYQDHDGPSHLVRHLHFLGWPDHGTPSDIRSLLQFMKFVEACNTDKTHADAALNPDPPVVIGCSAGVGRTGTFIALDSILRAFGLNRPDNSPLPQLASQANRNPGTNQSGQPPADWSTLDLGPSPLGALPDGIAQDKIALEVDSLREQRPMMVQTAPQLRFIYQVFLAAIELEGKVRDGDLVQFKTSSNIHGVV